MAHQTERETYIIPPNFIESGTFFGGLLKARNVIEAGILAFLIGMPVFCWLPLGLTAKIVVLCLTALPVALLAVIGVGGESLSAFLLIYLKYRRNRRVIGETVPEEKRRTKDKLGDRDVSRRERNKETRKHIDKKVRKGKREDFPAEFDELKRY